MPDKDGTGPEGQGPKTTDQGKPLPKRVDGGGGKRSGKGRGRGGSPRGGGRGIKR